MSKKILISSIGTRGEVQPALALALELRTLGHQPVLCVPPNFQAWVESLQLECIPIGPDLAKFTAAQSNAKRGRPTMALMRQMVRDSVVEQFKVTSVAAQGCDLIVTAGDLQHAGKSIAESRKIPHVHATYCPVTLRSKEHTPPNLSWLVRSQTVTRLLKRMLWALSDAQWNALYRVTLNEQRATLALAAVKNVPAHIANERSWVAADAELAPARKYRGAQLFQTGAWVLRDERQLPDELEKFLAAGEPPVYFGFGSMRRSNTLNLVLLGAARALGRRIIVSKGWGGFGAGEDVTEAFVVDDVNHAKLFPRVAAVVHHGGAGTTTTAARAGVPQVIVPHLYDQYYWAHRVCQLGVGTRAAKASELDVELLLAAVRASLRIATVERAARMASRIQLDGARIAAERLVAMT